MEKGFDWCIVGAGPAGSTLARLLKGRGRILLLDRRRLDRPRLPGAPGKCCGGLLAPDAQKALAVFGLALPENTLGGPQLFAVRALDLASGLERLYQRFYLNLDREVFDRWLAGLAMGEGVTARWGVEWLDFRDNVVTFRTDGGELHEVRCRFLIAADGAAGAVRCRIGRHPVWGRDAYLAIQEQYEMCGESHFFDAFFDPELTDFYGWSIPKREVLLLGAALRPGSDACGRFAAFRRRLEARGFRFGRLVRREGAVLRRPLRIGDFWLGEGKVFAVGEAAGWISPSSAEGFSFAFRSARALAEVLTAGGEPTVDAVRRRAFGLFLDWRAKMLKSPLLYSPSLRRAIMAGGVTAIR